MFFCLRQITIASCLIAIVCVSVGQSARAEEGASQCGESQSTWAPERVRISAAGGAGYANERAAHDKGAYAAGSLQVTAFVFEGLRLGLAFDMLSAYDRKVPIDEPARSSSMPLVLKVRERMPRGRLLAGYELLRHLIDDRDRAQLTPYGLLELTSFANDALPQRTLALGGGLALEVRVHEGLRLLGDFAYASVAQRSDPETQRRLALGMLTGSLHLGVGAAFAIGKVARLEIRYHGEQLYFQHATRVLDTVLFGPTFHVR